MKRIKLNMKKIGIITPNGYYNYGNRLQNYALQETLKCLGYDVETLIVQCKKPEPAKPVPYQGVGLFKRIVDRPFLENLQIVARRIKRLLNNGNMAKRQQQLAEAMAERESAFLEFSRCYINEKDYSITGESFPPELVDQFSYYVVGSDQVWNPFYHWGMTSSYWLDFAPKCKRVSYAASFGVSSIPDEYTDIYRSYLLKLKSISVREEQAKVIIAELTGRTDVRVHVDPVLLLTKEHWENISKEHSNKPEDKYILTYFLGSISDDIAHKIEFMAKRLNCNIVNLAADDDLQALTADPSDFLDYINCAEFFYTDSFHGCAFSILFNTNFIVCPREEVSSPNQSMESRIETLLSMFRLDSRMVCNITSLDDAFNVDFSFVSNVLEQEREKAMKYLTDVLV
jgi:hypothetical protein